MRPSSPRGRSERKRRAESEVYLGRQSVNGAAVESFLKRLSEDEEDVVIAIDRRIAVDRLVGMKRLAFDLAGEGAVSAMEVVFLAPRQAWLSVFTQVRFDDAVFRSPPPVDPVLSRRPAADPRPFVEHQGRRLKLTLRNGMILSLQLVAVGPYDLIVGGDAGELLVPLHALVAWEPVAG